MAKNVTIAGNSYSSVPAVDIPLTAGGTARFYSCEGSTDITENGSFDVTGLASVLVNVASGGGLPSGISKIACGEYTVSSDFTTSRQTVTHNMGVVPDLVFFYYDGGNIATTYTMLWSLRCTKLGYRSSAYNLYNAYHGNSTTSVSVTNTSSTTVGVSNLTTTTFQIASHSTSYYWRGGKTYKWIAIKF